MKENGLMGKYEEYLRENLEEGMDQEEAEEDAIYRAGKEGEMPIEDE
jgi:hypothetical protein